LKKPWREKHRAEGIAHSTKEHGSYPVFFAISHVSFQFSPCSALSFLLLDICYSGRTIKLDLLGELDRLRDSAKSGTTPRTCWIMPAEGSKSWDESKPPVLSGIVGFFVFKPFGARRRGVAFRRRDTSRRLACSPARRPRKSALLPAHSKERNSAV
jgi:hypothetical protein